MREQFIAAWVTGQQRAFHQGTRGIMTPEDRAGLEKEAEEAMRAIEREAAAKALEDAAETIATALPGSEAVGYYASESDSGYLEAERDIEAHLRARAAEIRGEHGIDKE